MIVGHLAAEILLDLAPTHLFLLYEDLSQEVSQVFYFPKIGFLLDLFLHVFYFQVFFEKLWGLFHQVLGEVYCNDLWDFYVFQDPDLTIHDECQEQSRIIFNFLPVMANPPLSGSFEDF